MRGEVYYVGVDEAGRGCLVGDMIVAGVMVADRIVRDLVDAGVAESKQLTPDQRVTYHRLVLKKKPLVIEVFVPPWRIDKENLNKLEVEAISWILRTIQLIMSNVHDGDVEVYIDEVKGRATQLESIVRRLFGSKLRTLRVESDADAKYAPVAIASIFAKVTRDQSLEYLRKLVGDFGSGYPSDPRLEEWIKSIRPRLSKPPRFIRRSWSNLKEIAPEWFKEKKRGVVRSLLEFAKR